MSYTGSTAALRQKGYTMEKQAKDFSKAYFQKRCEHYGFKPEGIMGYYELPSGVCASVLNVGTRRRTQLAYLLKVEDKHAKINEAQAAARAQCNSDRSNDAQA